MDISPNKMYRCSISLVQFSCSVVSDSLRPHGLQHARPPCPLPAPRVYSNSCPLSLWCHPKISSSVIPFSSCLNLSQNQGLSQWVSSSHQVAEVLELCLLHYLSSVCQVGKKIKLQLELVWKLHKINKLIWEVHQGIWHTSIFIWIFLYHLCERSHWPHSKCSHVLYLWHGNETLRAGGWR